MLRSIALRDAGVRIGNHRLVECDLFVTIEPCAMCAGALVHARIRRLVYGADDPKAGAVKSVMQVLNHPALNHQVEVRSGVLAGRCAELLQAFFRAGASRLIVGYRAVASRAENWSYSRPERLARG